MPGQWGFPFERVIRQAFPLDFCEGTGCYVATTFEIDTPLLRRRGVFGWTADYLDVALQSYLERDGRWIGRGFATIMDENAFSGVSPENRELVFLHAIAHELAHYFTFPKPEDTPATEQEREQDTAMVDAVLYAASPLKKRSVSTDDHGPAFLRSCSHVSARLLAAGIPSCVELMHVDQYGWSPAADYLTALDGEPKRRIHEPLRTVLADAPPAAFLELAASDRRRHQTEPIAA